MLFFFLVMSGNHKENPSFLTYATRTSSKYFVVVVTCKDIAT